MTEIQHERRPGEWMRRSILNNRKTEIKCIKKKNCVTISRMDGFTFVIKQPLKVSS